MNLDDFKDKDGKFIDFYQVLGVPDTADDETIKKAYRARCLFAHPDGKEEFERSWYEEEFKKINKAKDCLLNREERSQYDMYREKILRKRNFSGDIPRPDNRERPRPHARPEPEPEWDLETDAIFSFTSTDLYQAAKNGDIEDVRRFLNQGMDVNQRADHYHRETPLHAAAFAGHREIVKLLLAKGADVNRKDRRGYTPLHAASQECRKDVAEALIAAGADVNAKDGEGYRPLHLACSLSVQCTQRLATVQVLVKAGAQVNAQDNFLGDSPLHVASGNGHAEVVAYLVKMGADINAENNTARTPLESARRYNREEVMEVLMRGKD